MSVSTNMASAISFNYKDLNEAFPDVDHGREMLMSNFLCQLRRAKLKTAGGIELPDEVRRSEAGNCTVAKVVGLGPDCFHNPNSGKEWPQGPSFKVGDFLQVPRFGGFRFSVKYKGEEVDFVIFDHLQQLAKIKDPLTVTTYL